MTRRFSNYAAENFVKITINFFVYNIYAPRGSDVIFSKHCHHPPFSRFSLMHVYNAYIYV